MNKESVFVINVYRDFKDAMFCIQSIENSYPDTPIIVIFDGTTSTTFVEFCADHGVHIVEHQDRLYNKDCGKWIKRWIQEGLKYVSSNGFIVKIDPETEIRKPLSYIPKCDVFGCFHTPGKGFKRWTIQGGFHAISKESAEYLLKYNFTDNPIYLHEDFREYRVIKRHGNDASFLYNDAAVFTHICKTAKLACVDHREVFCCTKFGDTFNAIPYHIIHANTWRNLTPEPKPCKVFGIGLPKCATLSTVDALKILGYNGIHYPHDYLGCIEYFDAIFDLPISANFETLDKLYPNSKFIFNTRENIEEWVESLEWWYTEVVSKDTGIEENDHLKTLLTQSRKGIFGVEYYENKKQMLQGREDHINRVKEYFKGREQDLLWFDVSKGAGWDELCNFVQEDVPDRIFPHSHNHKEERKDFKSKW